MSIAEVIQWRVGDGMMYPVQPRAPGTSPRRSMFVTSELWNFLNATHDDEMEDRLGYLQADLEVFASGQTIDPKYLFLLYPAGDAVWEIRSIRHAPSIRVLGLFAARNTFVATNHALREDLGGWQSREWNAVKRLARARWRTLFHTYQPIETTDVRIVVSGALNGKYFKD